MNYTKSESPTPDVEEEEPPIVPFPLLDLPLELVLHILRCLDERSSATEASFPSGPPTELLHLAATSTFFYQQCRPRIWRSIRFEAQLGGMRPEAWVQRRSLRELVRIMQGSKVVEGASRFAARQGEDRALERGEGRISQATRSQDRPFAPLPIKAFSYSTPRHIPSGLEEDDIRMELEALLEVIWSLKHSKVQVLFLYAGDDLPMPKKLGAALMTAVLDLDALSALRMNQMYFSGKLEGIDQAKPMPQLRTLQIMHGSAKLVDLVRLAPNLASLLLWPHSRRFNSLGPIIAAQLPKLRLLSLDAVHDTGLITLLAETIETLASQGTPLPLTELFLEGKQTPTARSVLLQSLRHLPNLKRLALYHLRDAKPALLKEIEENAPGLQALTLVFGDTSRAVEWPATVAEYAHQLSHFPNLKFFAWDHRTSQGHFPVSAEDDSQPPLLKKRLELEYETLSALGQAVSGLREAVAITEDVSEGCEGYFATFQRGKGSAVRVHVKKDRATDFLVSFERWCVIAED